MKTNTTKSLARFIALLVAGAALASLVATSGCVAVAAGAGVGAAVAYVRGDLDTTLNAGFEKSVRAVDDAVTQLQFAKVSENKDALQAIIIARNASDKKIELRLDQLAEDATKLKIRVGTFGDDALTQRDSAEGEGEPLSVNAPIEFHTLIRWPRSEGTRGFSPRLASRNAG